MVSEQVHSVELREVCKYNRFTWKTSNKDIWCFFIAIDICELQLPLLALILILSVNYEGVGGYVMLALKVAEIGYRVIEN